MDILKDLSDASLLEVYELFVKINHYDPVETPQEYLNWRNKGVSEHSLYNELLRRLQRS
jgi:hypothetical protein